MTGPERPYSDGAITINKQAGLSSQEVVQKVRRITRLKRVGHAGTLDPAAEGVLPLLLGKATRLFTFLLQTRKVYRVCIRFGRATDTMDRMGTTTFENPGATLSRQELLELIGTFTGTIMQEPPMYSARHHEGERLYKLARRGVTVERPKKAVTIYEFHLLEFEYPDAECRIMCDRGTYVRALCHDLGVVAGCGAHLHYLVREQLGPFNLTSAITLDDLQHLWTDGDLGHAWLSMSETIGFLPAIVLTASELKRIICGNSVQLSPERIGKLMEGDNGLHCRLLSENLELKAVGQTRPAGATTRTLRTNVWSVQPLCVFE